MTIMLVAMALIVLLDALELVRRSASVPDVDGLVIATMAALHLPHLLEIVLPFAMFFAAIAALWSLTRHNEIAIARAAGLSVWQFLLPGFATAILIGILKITILNPLSASALSSYEDYNSQFFNKTANSPILQGKELWLRDVSGNGDIIVHARNNAESRGHFSNLTIFKFEDDGRFLARYDAASGVLEDGHWRLIEPAISGPAAASSQVAEVRVPTRLNWMRLEESFARPASLPIWQIPAFIELLESAGFSATAYKVHLHAALASPFTMAAMVLLAASFVLRPPRKGGLFPLLTLAASIGLGTYFLSQIFLRLGLSGQLPPLLSAWGAVGCISMLGGAWLLYTEDG